MDLKRPYHIILKTIQNTYTLKKTSTLLLQNIKWGAYGTVLGTAGTLLGATAGFLSQKWAGYELPVETVSYHEAQDFIKRLSKLSGRKFALPTENEWEYAARGGQASLGYKYAGSNNIDEVAWYRDNAEEQTHPVKQKKLTNSDYMTCAGTCGNGPVPPQLLTTTKTYQLHRFTVYVAEGVGGIKLVTAVYPNVTHQKWIKRPVV